MFGTPGVLIFEEGLRSDNFVLNNKRTPEWNTLLISLTSVPLFGLFFGP